MSTGTGHGEEAKAEDRANESISGEVYTMDQRPMFDTVKGERETFEATNSGLIGKADFDPTEIMVQVIQRPTDPMCKKLQQSLYGWVASGIAYMPVHDMFGGWIDVARNWQATLFRRASRFKYVLMIDSDIGPPMDAPYMLRRHGLPFVSAVACGWSPQKGGLFVCVAVPDANGKPRFITLKNDNPIPRTGLIEVTNAGTGCILVHRDVIEALFAKYERELAEEKVGVAALRQIIANYEKPGTGPSLSVAAIDALRAMSRRFNYEHDTWGAPFSIPQSVRDKAYETGQLSRGEDILFTDRIRKDLGIKIYCDLEVQCQHNKVMALLWPDEARKELTPGEWRPSIYSPEVGL